MDNMIIIPKDEYRDLVECAAMVKALEEYAHTEVYGISKEVCGALLGFDLRCLKNDRD